MYIFTYHISNNHNNNRRPHRILCPTACPAPLGTRSHCVPATCGSMRTWPHCVPGPTACPALLPHCIAYPAPLRAQPHRLLRPHSVLRPRNPKTGFA